MAKDNQNIIKLAKEVIQTELNAIANLPKHLNDNFVLAVKAILTCKSRVVVTGIGKSAIIGQKITATFNSTGTPSLFMHAADAIHGDLGMIQSGDVILALSKSGNTPEIKELAPLLKRNDNILIVITAQEQSSLAQFADFVLLSPIEQEADPNKLAPTASTTCQLVLGDALAMCVQSLRGFTANDFALLHPGGSLGKQLYLKVTDLLKQHTGMPQVLPSASLSELIVEISSKRLGATAVVDAQMRVCGIITDGDLRRMLQKNDLAQPKTAAEIMSHSPKYISSDALAVDALQLLKKYNINQLLVADEGIYKGMLHLHDLLREGLL
ncbi:MAG: KpsF/GutQ family sugar-phosphate isomerase [Chitinophagales bacterium]